MRIPGKRIAGTNKLVALTLTLSPRRGNGVGARGWKNRRVSAGTTAFTLIELLVVIGVIALIAALVLGVMPGVMHRRVMARVQTELTQLQGAIEYYKEKHGFYPPDNTNNMAEPPLFYELVGTTINGAIYSPLNGDTNVLRAQITAAFGLDGFLNCQDEAKNFYPTL